LASAATNEYLAVVDAGKVATHNMETVMNEETFNLSMRKFLKMVGVSSQNEIEKAVAKALADSSITGTETLPATMTLEIASLKMNVKFDGNILLE
jgi:hypothetical protein